MYNELAGPVYGHPLLSVRVCLFGSYAANLRLSRILSLATIAFLRSNITSTHGDPHAKQAEQVAPAKVASPEYGRGECHLFA